MIDKANYINYIVEDKSVVYSVLEYGILQTVVLFKIGDKKYNFI